MKQKKRHGETYADVLTRKRQENDLKAQLIIREYEKEAVNTTIVLSMIALNETEHMGEKRLRRFLATVQELSNEAMRIQHEDGREVALYKMESRLKQIMGEKFNTSALIRYDAEYLMEK